MNQRCCAALAAALLAGCSGSSTIPNAGTPGSSAGTSNVSFVVMVPAIPPPSLRAHAVPVSTQSIVVALSGKPVVTLDVAAGSHACAASSSGRRCTGRAQVRSGSETFDLTAYDQPAGKGNVLATGSVQANLAPGASNRVGLSLTGKIASISLAIAAPYPPAGTPARVAVVANALDADGNTILGSYASPGLTLSDSDTTGATKLSVTTLAGSSARAEITYDGHSVGAVTIVAKAAGVPAASAPFSPEPTTVDQYNAGWLHLSPTQVYPIGYSDICRGPDGNMWIAGATAGAIVKVRPDGSTTNYPAPFSEPLGINVGSDGELWFAEGQGGSIDRISTSGKIVRYVIPVPSKVTSQPSWVAMGPDKREWYVDEGIGTVAVGAVTTGGKFSQYPLPKNALPEEIVAGPDGNLWITDPGENAVVVMSTSGHVVATHPVPAASAAPWGITVGPDKNVWFAEYSAGNIGRLTVANGKIDEFPVPTYFAGPLNVTPGPDGNVWFTESAGGFWDVAGKVGYITPDGKTIREYPGGPISAHVHNLAFDASGNLWYTKFNEAYSAVDKLVY